MTSANNQVFVNSSCMTHINFEASCTAGDVEFKGIGSLQDASSVSPNLDRWMDIDDLQDILIDTDDMQPKFGPMTDLGDGATIDDMLTAIAGKTANAGSYNRADDSLEAI
jgi:hypothetical protein